ncbi:hypothetical protein C1X59_17265 [Pseudomonas sp. FW215-R2]|nr:MULTISPECIES: hypothetical protein [unclassified Pseudomonas]PMW99569.1 hypothetical protein C1X59_17265 [Pseudomonas sp. FW215-R2]PMX07458.1 hypothetical protein C1X60_20765 [Pseudomonas sp. FW215-L1]PMX20291.1 hypothetical protein C1X57_21685 [Pseudomonas sp. FW215-E1]PNA27402.1 hypothetical protein C1X58_19130 [Pseudomonas sp. FW215-R4]
MAENGQKQTFASDWFRPETDKGSPLTESEVLKIRDQATCVAVPFDVAFDMENERGFRDLVAEDCWNEWQRVRLSMKKPL